jgi:thymidylate synthase
MKQYQDLIKHVLSNGTDRADRTGTGIKSVFGYQMRFDLQQGFPILTTKKIHWHSVAHELLWFLSGATTTEYLDTHNVKIWNGWKTDFPAIGWDKDCDAYTIPANSIGPMYGKQWTAWETPDGTLINQIEEVVNTIKTNPNSRRMLVSAWNPADLPDESISPQDNVKQGRMALAACHAFFQFYISEEKLSCQVYQRSADVFLGIPFNLASYALLVHLIAQQSDLEVGELIWVGGDTHIYSNHYSQVELQLTREPKTLPKLNIKRKPNTVFDYNFEDFELVGYDPHPLIKGKVSV